MFEKNELITFALPTYNRANFIDELLAHLLTELELFEYPIWVCDNCSTDNTQKIVLSYKEKYDNIIYTKHESNIGADRNALFIKDNFETKYLWLVGDGVRFNKGNFNSILNILSNNDYDAILLNYGDRVIDISSGVYTDRNKLLTDLGWHATQYSANIYPKKAFAEPFPEILSEGSSFNFYFRFFDYLGKKEQIKVYWYEHNSFAFTQLQKPNSWHSNIVSIWVKNFTETILALPISYTLNSKLHCLKSYGKTHGLFKLKTVIAYTIKGYYVPSDIIRYKTHFQLLMPNNWRVYYMLFNIPKPILSFLGKLKESIKNLRKTSNML